VEEENYFFKLSKYKEAIKAHIEQNPDFILPEFRAQEVLKMLENLEDISVSRSKSSVSWGIPVPGDEDQRIYVWIDALSNYVTGVGYLQAPALFKKFWPADVHLIGKDILRFHAIYWPAMLMSAGIQLPKTVFAHGFITINEAKMGKSLGNIVSPSSIVERFELSNTDPIRYYLMTCTSFGQDGNYSEDDFKLRVNADLANNLGNLLNRTLNMTTKYFEGQVPQATLKAEFNKPEDFRAIEKAYDGFAFQAAAEAIFQWVDQANKLINESEPWTLFKNGQLEELANVLYTVLETLRRVAVALSPITPVLSEEIWRQLGYTTPLSSVDWSAIEQASLPAGQAINLQGPILPRLESEIVGAGKKK
jgi:methionyl-tRNA synthetase